MKELNLALINNMSLKDMLEEYEFEKVIELLLNKEHFEQCFDLIKRKIESAYVIENDIKCYRKKLYETYIRDKQEITSVAILNHIEYLMDISGDTPKRLNIPFYNVVRSYYMKHDKDNMGILNYKWRNFIDLDDLFDKPYGKGYYSQREQFFLDLVKYYCNENMYTEASNLICEYKEKYDSIVKSNGILYFAYYNLLKTYYNNGIFESAREILDSLLSIDRKGYILELPVKYYDIEWSKSVIFLIEIIVNDIKTTKYFTNVIVKFVHKLGLSINGFVYDMSLDTHSKSLLIKNLLTHLHEKDKTVFTCGEIYKKITKGSYFIKCGNESLFVSNKYSAISIDMGKTYQFIVINSFDAKKNIPSKIAVLYDTEV
jgi:tetratricopeptide (TPR) repeat protein